MRHGGSKTIVKGSGIGDLLRLECGCRLQLGEGHLLSSYFRATADALFSYTRPGWWRGATVVRGHGKVASDGQASPRGWPPTVPSDGHEKSPPARLTQVR